MKQMLLLAIRNLMRNRRRSVTSLLAVMIGGFSILMFGGYVRNITYGLETGFVTQSAHFQIQRKDYFLYGTSNPGAFGIEDYPAIIAAIKANMRLSSLTAVVTPILQLGGIAGNFAAGASRTNTPIRVKSPSSMACSGWTPQWSAMATIRSRRP